MALGADARRPSVPTDVERELLQRCPEPAPSPFTLEIKSGLDKRRACFRTAMNGELDRSLIPWKTTEPARFSATMREQAAFNAWTEVACQLVEDSHWFDLGKGIRYDGTLRSIPFMECQIGLREERFFFARAMVDGNDAGLASRVAEFRARGLGVVRKLVDVHKQAAALVSAPAPDGGTDCYPCPVGRAERAELLTRIESVQAGVNALAKSTCDAWPALAARLGGDDCPAALAPYYAAQLTFDELW